MSISENPSEDWEAGRLLIFSLNCGRCKLAGRRARPCSGYGRARLHMKYVAPGREVVIRSAGRAGSGSRGRKPQPTSATYHASQPHLHISFIVHSAAVC